jgi:AcrR family transcriptional regulator
MNRAQRYVFLVTIVTTAERRGPGRPRDLGNDVAILDATEHLLGRRGYEAMTIDQVAAAAGVSKPTIYKRYSGKRDLVWAMIDRLRPPLPDRFSGPAERDLVALIEIQREWVDVHGLRIVAAVLLEQDDHPELMQRFQERVVQPTRATFRDVLRAGVERGVHRRLVRATRAGRAHDVPTRYHVSIGPFPLTSIVPRGSHTKSSFTSSYVARVIWIAPGVPCDSIRLAVFTASPHRS